MIKAIAVLLIIIVIFFLGPKVDVDQTIRPVHLLENLDSFLAEQENRFDDIVEGTQKTIIWAEKPGTRTEYSLVYIHGFSATRKETAPLSDQVAKKLGANLFYTRLTGHGRPGEALAAASVNDWLNDVVQSYEIGKRLGKKVIMIGSSTGGTALAWLAHKAGTDVGMESLAACVFISPNFRPADPFAAILTWPWGKQLAEALIGKNRSWEPDAPGHDTYWTNQYPTRALLPMMGLVRLVGGLDLTKIKMPCLVIASPKDAVIDYSAVEKAFENISSRKKKLVPYTRSSDPSHHVLAGDILSPHTTGELAKMITDFVLP